MNDCSSELCLSAPKTKLPGTFQEEIAVDNSADLSLPNSTVIILHASVGSGHRTAANAICEAYGILKRNNSLIDLQDVAQNTLSPRENALSRVVIPANLHIEVLDVLQFGRHIFDGNHTASLFTGATRPIYDLTWRYTLTGRILWGGGTAFSHIMYPAFTDYVQKIKPTAIITTHIMAANVALGARMLSGQSYPVVCVPTDYETEGLWPHRCCDLFCVANESMAETLRARKVPDNKILITGIPAHPHFSATFSPKEKEQIRQKWGLPIDKRLLLVLAGAYLPRPYVNFRTTLAKAMPYFHTLHDSHLVILAGRDELYARETRENCSDLGLDNVTVLDYVDDMAGLMAASDLAICKAGGLTVTECLCAQVPMVLLGKAYGQEKANVRMLTSVGAAIHITTSRELLDVLAQIERRPKSVGAMLVNASFLRRPDASFAIARASLALADNPCMQQRAAEKHFIKFYLGNKPAHVR